MTAGLDVLAGGSWLGLNDHGVLAAILNRAGSLGPQAGKRSRGELVLEALDHGDASAAAEALSELDPAAYRSFNLVIADNRDAIWLANRADGSGSISVSSLPPGLSMLTARELNDGTSPRITRYLSRFRAAPEPQPDSGDWAAWQALLAERARPDEEDPTAAMTVVTPSGFETVSSSLIALPSPAAAEMDARPVWLFAAGRPDETPYRPIDL